MLLPAWWLLLLLPAATQGEVTGGWWHWVRSENPDESSVTKHDLARARRSAEPMRACQSFTPNRCGVDTPRMWHSQGGQDAAVMAILNLTGGFFIDLAANEPWLERDGLPSPAHTLR